MERRAWALAIAYGGRGFGGWQRQTGRPSVQGTLAEALASCGVRVSLAAAARTDAGVHARRQVATFRVRAHLDRETLLPALQAALPRSVRVLSLAPAAPSFHARASAVSREYRYRVRAGLSPCAGAWTLPDARSLPRVPAQLDLEAARAFLRAQLGLRDRAPFTTRPDGPALTELLQAELRRSGDGRFLFRFVAKGYTRHLVRNWVWAAVAIAAGVEAPFDGPHGWRGPRAPGHGLVLWDVTYPGSLYPPLPARVERAGELTGS